MKIAVHLTIDVDQAAWSEAHDLPPAEVREDVKTWVGMEIALSNAAEEKLIRSVCVR